MKAWLNELIHEKVELQVAPLIDVVFLLLIYFMVSASLRRTEADLSLTLPGTVGQAEVMQIPDEQVVEVRADGSLYFNGRTYLTRADLRELEFVLTRYREASQQLGTPPSITIAADDDALHGRVTDVLNAAAGAGIHQIVFAADGLAQP